MLLSAGPLCDETPGTLPPTRLCATSRRLIELFPERRALLTSKNLQSMVVISGSHQRRQPEVAFEE
jgi:hypothetical protein